MNEHANHTVYFEWALENIPDEAIAGLSLVRLDAEFFSSVKRERVTVKTKITCENPLSFSHEISAEDGTPAARVSTVYQTDRR
jgi:acyl-ACP thioesterase